MAAAAAGSTVGVTAEMPPPALDVTYLAHAGFMVRAAGKTVLVDALFSPEFATMVGPPPEILKKILEGREPFHEVDLILVTHKDGDHFDAASVVACLRSHPQCRLVAHTQVVDWMRSIDGFAQIQSQIQEIKLEAGARERVSHHGVAVDALALYHEHRPQTTNLAFVVEMGGARFVHMGDAFFAESEAHLKSYPFEQAPIDLLFLNQYDRYGAAPRLIKERIKPVHLVAMHLYPVAMDQYPDEFSDDATKVRAAYPGIIVFGKPMERRVFARASETFSRDAQRVEPAGGLAAREDNNSTAASPAGGAHAVRPAGMRLEWTRFICGSGDEFLGWQASPPAYLGSDGMLWLTGVTKSRDFPTTPDALYPTYKGGNLQQSTEDCFLLKFNTRQPGIVYSTFLGGAKGPVFSTSTGVDGAGNIAIVGHTRASDFPTTGDALTKQFEGDAGFLTILGDDGRKLNYSTFIGGSGKDRVGPDWVEQVFVESSGELTLFGITGSRSFPSADALRPQGLKVGRAFALFVMRLDAKGQRVLYSRVLANSWGMNVQRLDSGDFLIAGTTTNPAFPATEGARTYHGGGGIAGGDIFVMRLSADLRTVSFATLFGGTGEELWPKIVPVPGGDFFVLGKTTSTDLPVTTDAIEKTMESDEAVFLARFSGDGRRLKYCTYLGGQGTEVTSWIGTLAYDGHSRVYATGTTTSPRFPVTPDALQATHHGGRDAFLLAFNIADNSLAYGSYLGGSKNDGACLALDENGALYLFGGTDSDDFPTLEKTPAPRKGRDLFIAKFTAGTVASGSAIKSQ